jgi:hypothetical protein
MKIAIVTLALTCLGQSYEKVTATGKDWAVFTPPKVGTPPSETGNGVSYSESCSIEGLMTSYPQPGKLGDLNGTRKCFNFCYENNYTAASCQSNYCLCLTYVPKRDNGSGLTPSVLRLLELAHLRLPASDETLNRSYKKVSSGGRDIAVFTPPKAGTPPIQMGKSVSFSERCSDQGFLTSYPQPGTMGDLNGTRKCFDYCYSLSFKAALCIKDACLCLRYNPTD